MSFQERLEALRVLMELREFSDKFGLGSEIDLKIDELILKYLNFL